MGVSLANPFSRRSFLQTSATAAASAGLYFSSTAALTADEKSPNEQPNFGYIGTGIRFHTALGPFSTELGPGLAVADVDAVQAGRAKQVIFDQHREFNRPLVVHTHEDYRHVLDNKEIDAVLIGSPDHWHTKHVVEAMQAGKDVYCEKPLTLTIKEGQQILETIKKTGQVLQVGTQQRTEFGQRFATAVAMMHDNRIGDVKKLTVAIGGSRDSGSMPVADPPQGLNWEKWLGQCPVVPYREGKWVDTSGWGAGHPFSRAHRYYRWFYEYSGGKLTDWGAHHVDIAMWSIKKLTSDIGNIEIDPLSVVHPVEFKDGMPMQDDRFNCALKFNVKVTFKDGIEMFVTDNASDSLGFENGIMFEGSKGRFLVNRGKLVGKPVEQLKSNPLPGDWADKLYGRPAPKSHMQHFVDCIKSRETPISDAESHHRMLAVCHAINIAMRLNRKLTFDPATDKFVGDEQANSFIAREQRKGYEINV